jgi:hypothetical protein
MLRVESLGPPHRTRATRSSCPELAEADRYGRSMGKCEGALRTVATVVLALAINVVLDIAFDLPMLARWAIVLSVVLLVNLLIEAVRRRADAGRPDPDRT